MAGMAKAQQEMKRCREQRDRRATHMLAFLALACASWSCMADISIVGVLDPANPQDVYLYTFTLPAPATVSIQGECDPAWRIRSLRVRVQRHGSCCDVPGLQ
jgi:hypothetical protein